MPTPFSDLPKLFGSLKPSPESAQDHAEAAARQAQQKWPLLGSVAPEAPSATPELPEEERLRRHAPGSTIARARLAESPQPSFGQALALNLGKMATWAPPTSPSPSASEAPPPSPPPIQAIVAPPSPLDTILEKPAPPSIERSQLFRAEDRSPAKGTLASIFNRIEGKTAPSTASDAPKPSSFMSRIGKR